MEDREYNEYLKLKEEVGKKQKWLIILFCLGIMTGIGMFYPMLIEIMDPTKGLIVSICIGMYYGMAFTAVPIIYKNFPFIALNLVTILIKLFIVLVVSAFTAPFFLISFFKKKSKLKAMEKQYFSSTAEEVFSGFHDEGKMKNGGWKCPDCGRVNQSYIGTCVCGKEKL